jgi:hypothetical protein
MVSAPTLLARTRSNPVRLMVAPITVSPVRLVTGIDSPVTIDSSTAELAVSTVASTGIFPPGRIMTSSPTTTSLTLIRSLCRRGSPARYGPATRQGTDQSQDYSDRLEVHLPHAPGRVGATVSSRCSR